jgi:CheY-like chemotaxis protein
MVSGRHGLCIHPVKRIICQESDQDVTEMSGRKFRLLIADDAEAFLFSSSLALRASGYHVDTATDGISALERAAAAEEKGEPYDLIISDIVMPGYDGIELIDALLDKGIDIPVMVITGFLDSDYREALQTRGYPDALEKPFSPEELLSNVRRILIRAMGQTV